MDTSRASKSKILVLNSSKSGNEAFFLAFTAFKNIKLGGFTAAYVKFNAKLGLARSISQVGKAKASTANKQSANEPSKSARDKALANSLPRHALARSSAKTSASALKQNYAKALPQVAN